MKIGFISTRLAGTDGVSLETHKWAEVARRLGHEVYYCAGQLEENAPNPTLIPEFHFRDPEAEAISEMVFGRMEPPPDLALRLEEATKQLKTRLLGWLSESAVDVMVVENALAIPLHVPLGLALTEVIAETNIPTIGHHHDFWWERERFRLNCIPDTLETAFPPDLPNLRHVVINSLAQRSLRTRRGIESTIIPNVFDFGTLPPGTDDYNADLREAIGLSAGDHFILQPTRVVPRKGIELAIELVSRMQDARCKLVITHPAGDEGLDYLHQLQAQAAAAGIDLQYVADRFDSQRSTTPEGHKIYSLWDAYAHADFVTYPSLYEGFGNALIEAVYFHRPVMVNRYPVYVADIGPLGFDFVEIDGRITDAAVAQVRELLASPSRCKQMVEHNYRLGQEHFSLERLEELLQGLLEEIESS